MATSTTPTLPKPPDRLPDDAGDATDELLAYLWLFFKNYQNVQQLPQRLEAIAVLEPLALTISNPPTQAQVQAISDKVDAIIAAARRLTT